MSDAILERRDALFHNLENMAGRMRERSMRDGTKSDWLVWRNESARLEGLIEEAHFEIKRLSQIERQVRQLADMWDSAADEADEDLFASGEAVERCRRHARKLRAIIDPPENR